MIQIHDTYDYVVCDSFENGLYDTTSLHCNANTTLLEQSTVLDSVEWWKTICVNCAVVVACLTDSNTHPPNAQMKINE